jgi:general secretion pathway protein G
MRSPNWCIPLQIQPDAKRWTGPYMSNENLLIDPWGNAYRIEAPGKHHPEGYDLWSSGPDGIDQTTDDIGNW